MGNRNESINSLARRASTKRCKKFAKNKGFVEGRTNGDDVIYFHPSETLPNGMNAYIKITLNVKEGIPPLTMKTMIETSGLSRSDWAEGL